MNLISKPAFLKRPQFARQTLRRPGAPIEKECGGSARHLRWAMGIVSKHGRRTQWPGICPEAMTLARAFGLRVFRSQTIVNSARAEGRLLATAVKERGAVNARELKRQPERRLQLAASPAATAGRNRTVSPSAGAFPQAKTQPKAFASPESGTRIVEFIKKISASRIVRQTNGKAPAEGQLPLIRTDRSVQRLRACVVSDRGGAVLPEGLMRKHRRIEEHPFLRPREAAPKMKPAVEKEQPTRIYQAPARLRAHEDFFSMESARRRGATSPAPSVNVAQITDEVLRQLDRRLIAARERMGRI
jgi:hypothetical protein